MDITADFLIRSLELVSNPEGGYFRETYREPVTNRSGRAAVSIIYYLLTPEEPVGYLHRQAADAIHYFHCGSTLDVHTVDAEGRLNIHTMGANLHTGQSLQLVVPGNMWKAFELRGVPYALISEVVCPAWVAEEDERADSEFLQEYPHLRDDLQHLIQSKE